MRDEEQQIVERRRALEGEDVWLDATGAQQPSSALENELRDRDAAQIESVVYCSNFF